MKPLHLKLRFERPDSRGTAGNAWIVPATRRVDEKGCALLTPHLASLSATEAHIDEIKAELEDIRKQARKKFAAAAKLPRKSLFDSN